MRPFTKTNGAAAKSIPRPGAARPFLALDGCSPVTGGGIRSYRMIRDAIPVLDAAISKLVRLTGGVTVECRDARAQTQLANFLRTVSTGHAQRGFDSFLDQYLDAMLTCGCAVGEIVLRDDREIAALLCGDVTRICVREGRSPMDFAICVPGKPGEKPRALPHQELLLFTPFAPSEENPYGNSLLSGMSYLAGVLLRIYQAIGQNWQRAGDVRYAVICRPAGENLSGALARERSEIIAREWAAAMGADGPVSDFIAVGDVDIHAIGADSQILDSEVPVRQLLEQLVAKTGVPPFLLGLSWSTTERMSTQQTDILTTEITAIRRSLTPVVERVCDLWLRLHGFDTPYQVVWSDINLQDEVEEARAALYRAQARNLMPEEENAL